MDYLLHNVHFILGLVAVVIYIIRGGLMLANQSSKLMMTLAALTTLVLFGTGIGLVFSIPDISFANSWVMTKVVGLLLFVFFGVIALKTGLSKPVAVVLWLLGLAVFIYTFLIAEGILNPIG